VLLGEDKGCTGFALGIERVEGLLQVPPLAAALQIVPPDRAGWTLVINGPGVS
jgi:hypothetical protein